MYVIVEKTSYKHVKFLYMCINIGFFKYFLKPALEFAKGAFVAHNLLCSYEWFILYYYSKFPF